LENSTNQTFGMIEKLSEKLKVFAIADKYVSNHIN